MALTRIDKLLADSGTVSRREAKALLREGRVTVNGAVVRAPEARFDPETDAVAVDGAPLSCSPLRYVLLYKPAGVLSATEDAAQKTVLDLLPEQLRRQALFPVGRLDKDTTGLLLLTNDGDFAHRVISPKKHVPKRYLATLDAPLTPSDVTAFAEGLVLADGTQCLPAGLEITAPCVGAVTVYEGKNHQVKRMFAACGKRVTALHRFAVGALKLDPAMEPGAYRVLERGEAEAVFRAE